MADDLLANIKLPKLNQPEIPNVTSANQSYDMIYKLLSTPQASMTQDVLPAIQASLQAPTAGIKESGAQMEAAAQSDAMKRGMTGSDIEAAGLLGARQATAQMLYDAHAQISQQLAQYIMQAAGMDIQANIQMYTNLAQAIGQKLSQDQEYSMFMQQMQAGKDQASQASKNALWGAAINAIGSIGGGLLGGAAGPAIGGAIKAGAGAVGSASGSNNSSSSLDAINTYSLGSGSYPGRR